MIVCIARYTEFYIAFNILSSPLIKPVKAIAEFATIFSSTAVWDLTQSDIAIYRI